MALSNAAVIVATLSESPSDELVAELGRRADILEVREDLSRGIGPTWLRQRFPGRLLYTLRSREEGGQSERTGERRHRQLVAAAQQFDLVDLEVARDMTPDLLEAIPPRKRLVSWHGPPSTVGELQQVRERMQQHQAALFKIVPRAEVSGQEMAPLALLRSQRREDLVAFASGELGTWTRLVAPTLGAPVVYGAGTPVPAVPGQLTVRQLIDDYRLPQLTDAAELFGLVGRGIGGSLSPRLHTTMYRELGLPYLYLPFEVDSFGEFWLEVVESGAFEELGFHLRGLSVTAPYKRIASAIAGASSPLVEWLGSANTLVDRDGVWEAESTDGEGVSIPLEERLGSLKGRTAAVVGAGGAGRAAAVALRKSGVEVTLVNRSVEAGRTAARELRLAFAALEGFDPGGFDIVVHATPIGGAEEDPLPFDPSRMHREAVVLDFVYRPTGPTPLVEEARAAGRLAVDGREVLAYQAVSQFRIMTGHELPRTRALEILGV